MLYEWIIDWLLPLIGEIPPYELKLFTTIFWVAVSLCVTHFLVCVPYRLFMKLIKHDGGILPWLKSWRL